MGSIELNPILLGTIFSLPTEAIESGIATLCAPDKRSRTKTEDGRRLIREGEFQYRMVNWEIYDKIKSEEGRREYNRRRMARYRKNKKGETAPFTAAFPPQSKKPKLRGGPLPGENACLRAQEQGVDTSASDFLPDGM